MLPTTSQVDAGFFQLIHRLVGPQLRANQPAERRRGMRHPFPARQRIAPRRGTDFPPDREFVEVRCYDLTRAGFSFLLPAEPGFTSLVAAFGNPSETIYVAAEVVRCESVLLYASGGVERVVDAPGHGDPGPEEGEATPMVLVACRFTERLEKPRGRSS
jgi:hypothetical protein